MAGSPILRFLSAAVCCSSLISCTHSTRDIYDNKDVGKTAPAASGQIAASRIVSIRGQTSDAGAAAGGVLGGAGTGMATDNGWAAMIGAVLGAGLGYATERGINSREGIEYVIQLSDGRRIMLTQNRDGDEAPIANGTPVLVQLGGKYRRVFPDPTATLPAAGPAAAAAGLGAASAPLSPPPQPAPAVPAAAAVSAPPLP
ncbi:exported hypothetical protein [uncultured Defluviicoccus sp.]|uniref:Outer membrane lipoprotein SlyB n=1 Tax=metagenome TaxID=256318 RepID=A0A380TF48_9ZZZZ|nr:exported hypothetical protein [uncultured Defluviicoccus sp.]